MDLSKEAGLGMGQWGMARGKVGLLRGAGGMGRVASLHLRCYSSSSSATPAEAPMTARGDPPSLLAVPTLPWVMLKLSSALQTRREQSWSFPSLSPPRSRVQDLAPHQKQRFPGHLQTTLPALAGAGSSQPALMHLL